MTVENIKTLVVFSVFKLDQHRNRYNFDLFSKALDKLENRDFDAFFLLTENVPNTNQYISIVDNKLNSALNRLSTQVIKRQLDGELYKQVLYFDSNVNPLRPVPENLIKYLNMKVRPNEIFFFGKNQHNSFLTSMFVFSTMLSYLKLNEQNWINEQLVNFIVDRFSLTPNWLK